MYQLDKAQKRDMIEKVVDSMLIQYDESSNSIYIGIPSNVVIHCNGNVIFQSNNEIIIDAKHLHLNPLSSTISKLSGIFNKLLNKGEH